MRIISLSEAYLQTKMEMDTLITSNVGLRSSVHLICMPTGEESISKRRHHMTEFYSMVLTTMNIEHILVISEAQRRGIHCLITRLLSNSRLMEVSVILVDFNYF